jgi:hypothetical protein
VTPAPLPPEPAFKRKIGGKPLRDWTGSKVGVLVVLQRAEKPANRSMSASTSGWWLCDCVCGARVVAAAERLVSGAKRCACAGKAIPKPRAPRTRCKVCLAREVARDARHGSEASYPSR